MGKPGIVPSAFLFEKVANCNYRVSAKGGAVSHKSINCKEEKKVMDKKYKIIKT